MSMQQQERFQRLQFPVHRITAKTPVELFEILPGLRRYFQQLTSVDIKQLAPNYKPKGDGSDDRGYEPKYRGVFVDDLVKIIKYIVFMYDPDSDILTEYPDDLSLMKEAAAKEAGFQRTKDGEWPEYVQRILSFQEKAVVDWIIDYLKVKKNQIWMQIKFAEEELETLYRQRATALLKGEVKPDLMQLIKVRTDERDSLYKRMYSEHIDLKKATQDDLWPIDPQNVFRVLQIPADVYKMKQVRDVSKNTGVIEAGD